MASLWSNKLLTGGRKRNSPAQHKYYSEFLGSISLMSMELLTWILASALFPPKTPPLLPSLLHSRSAFTSEQVLICQKYYCPALTFRLRMGTGPSCDMIGSCWMCVSLACLNTQTYSEICPWHSNCQMEFFSKCSHTRFYSVWELERLGWMIARRSRLNTPLRCTHGALKGL